MTLSLPGHLLATCLLLALVACDDATGDADRDVPPLAEDAAIVTGGQAGEDVAGVPGPSPTDDAVAPAREGRVPRWDGLGPATFGMTADEVRAAWNGELVDSRVEGPACFHLAPAAPPAETPFAMMFGAGRFVRYSVSDDAMTAPGGGRRGMSREEIERLYPDGVERQPHKYVDGEYLRIEGDGGIVLVFETDAIGTVTAWRVGVPPYVDYVEGCA